MPDGIEKDLNNCLKLFADYIIKYAYLPYSSLTRNSEHKVHKNKHNFVSFVPLCL